MANVHPSTRILTFRRPKAVLLWGASLAHVLLAGAGQSLAAGKPSPGEITAQRQDIISNILTSDPPSTVEDSRWVCAMGRAPTLVSKSRAEGDDFMPDAVDECMAALTRKAHDRGLPELYSKLLTQLGSSTEGYEKLPHAIGTAVMNGSGKAPIGGGKVATVTPALAFDAGFTVAYQEDAGNQPPSVTDAQLRVLAEGCLNQQQDAGSCFSAGYMYGVKALRSQGAGR